MSEETQDAKPVAWLVERANPLFPYTVTTRKPHDMESYPVTPLYRHPPLDREALRDRIAEIFQAYDELGYRLDWDELDDEAHRQFRNAADRVLDLIEGRETNNG